VGKKVITRLSHSVVKEQGKECGRKGGFHSLTFHSFYWCAIKGWFVLFSKLAILVPLIQYGIRTLD
jgi:hypothetical protein